MCDLSIVIVNWNTRDLLRACLASLSDAARRIACEIIVVDNASTDGSAEMVRTAFPHVRLMALPENVGFARANNLGFAHAQGRYFLLLNPDTWLPPGALDEMTALMDRMPDVGILGPRLLTPTAVCNHHAAGFRRSSTSRWIAGASAGSRRATACLPASK